MIYSDLPAGATVFVDAGPFIHHFEPNAIFGPASTDLLERIEKNHIRLLTSRSKEGDDGQFLLRANRQT